MTAETHAQGPLVVPSSKKHPFIEPQAARALRPGVQIAGRGGSVLGPWGRLPLGRGGAAVDGVAGVSLPQPIPDATGLTPALGLVLHDAPPGFSLFSPAATHWGASDRTA